MAALPSDARWIFFDLDGTLADSLPGLHSSIAEAFAACGREMPGCDLRPFIGPGIRVILRNLEPSLTDDEVGRMERAFRESYDGRGVLNTTLFPAAGDLLRELRGEGRELFVVTNKPVRATSALLGKFELSDLFTAVLSRDSRQPPYPDKGEMLRELVESYKAVPEQSLMVGDTAEDLHAAASVGMPFVHAAYGYGTVGSTTTATAADISELRKLCLAAKAAADSE